MTQVPAPASTVSTGELFTEITGSTATLAHLIDGADLTITVPTCPEWTLRQLITHVGRAQRWASEIVSTRAHEPIPFREVPGGRLPSDPGEHPAWLRTGAARLVEVVSAAGAGQVWTFTGMGPATYWARRMAHETAVHRADCQLTFGQQPVIRPEIAADGISEWLHLICQPGDERARHLAGEWAGHSLHLHATDDGLGTGGEWTARGDAGGVAVAQGHAKSDVAVRGPASALLLLLTRRIPADDPAVEVAGDRGLLRTWLAATPF